MIPAAANLRAGSWRRAVAKRLAVVLLVTILGAFGGVTAIYLSTNKSSGENQLDDAVGHFKARVATVENSWLIQAEAFRSQLEFTRALDGPDERLRQARLVAYAASFGGQGAFSHVVVIGPDGRVMHRYRTQSQQDLALPAPAGVTKAWVFGERDGLLYRAISAPIRINQASGTLLLYTPVDNALLGSNVYPNTHASLLWQGRSVAQSPPLTTDVGTGMLLQQRNSKAERVVPWDSADAGGPEIAIERVVNLPLSLVDVLLTVLAAAAAIAALGWFALGNWLTAQSRRITALEHAAGAFALAPQVSPEVHDELGSVRDASGDEVSRLAQTLLGMMRDIEQSISERKLAQKAIAESERRFSSFFGDAPAGLAIFDRDHRWIYCNPTLARINGVPADALVGKRPSEVFSPKLAAEVEAGLERTLTLGESFFNRAASGLTPADPDVVHHWLYSQFPLRDVQGRINGVGTVVVDTTLQKQAEEALKSLNGELELHRLHLEELVVERTDTLLQRNEELNKTRYQLLQSEKLASLGGLVAGVSHELNTPMGNALTTASTLQYKVKQFAQDSSSGLRRSQLEAFMAHCAEAADLIVRNISKAASLVSSFKRISVDQTGEQRCTFSLADVVEETLRAVSPAFKNAKVHIQADIPRELDLDSFPGAIEQVLTNLVQNAVIHAHDGVRPLQIAIQARSAEGHNLQLVISDDGRGMDPETAKRAFDPYFTTRFGQGGSGLGLYIVHNLVTGTLGGSVSLDSATGKGAVFTVRIPLVAPQAMSQMQAKPLEEG